MKVWICWDMDGGAFIWKIKPTYKENNGEWSCGELLDDAYSSVPVLDGLNRSTIQELEIPFTDWSCYEEYNYGSENDPEEIV